MSSTAAVLLLLVLHAGAIPAQSEALTSVLTAAGRVTDWSQPGVPGGIPDRTTLCAALGPRATVGKINDVIAKCRDGVVALEAGVYDLSAGITFRGSSNVTLRGAGPDRTILRFTAPDPCGGLHADVCMRGSPDVWSGNVPSSNIRNWTGGFAPGTQEITLDSTSGLAVGLVIVLDQLDDAVDTNGIYVCASRSCSQEGAPAGRPGRAQQQFVRVTALDGNRVRITPRLHMVNWRPSQRPQAWWWGPSAVGNGLEGLTLDHTASGGISGIGFQNSYASWVRNVKSVNAGRNHVWLNQAARIEIRDSYFHGTKNAASQSYGVELYATSDALVVNNIFHRVTAPIMTGNSVGVVVAYNYMTDMHYTASHWMIAGLQGSHDAGTGMNLFEGNVGNGFVMDTYHGTGSLTTIFRNRLTGTDGTKTANTIPVNIFAYNRFVNVIGNVLGTPGRHEVYESSRSSARGRPNHSIYVLGYSGVLESTHASIPYDPMVLSTLLRWGNFDYATKRATWSAGEIPRDVAPPGSRTLPASLFLSARPSWWGSIAWPAIGPDVSGGQDPAGHAHRIPAQICFETTPRQADGTLSFDAVACYAGATMTTPRERPDPFARPEPSSELRAPPRGAELRPSPRHGSARL
jgi:hypothetical protein